MVVLLLCFSVGFFSDVKHGVPVGLRGGVDVGLVEDGPEWPVAEVGAYVFVGHPEADESCDVRWLFPFGEHQEVECLGGVAVEGRCQLQSELLLSFFGCVVCCAGLQS